MKKIVLGLVLSFSLFGNDNTEEIFTAIYRNSSWGANEQGVGFSGPGSTLSNTSDYVKFLEEFMKIHQIKTVVDAGCGDWTFSKEITWGEVQYLGVDVVKSVIDEDIQKYASDTVHFEHLDILRFELPSADLLICKDVLMHLANEDIIFFLKSIKNFKHCLFTHNSGQENENIDIQRGEWRPLDLTKPPFNLSGIKIFAYSTDHGPKQVLYYGN